jgi:hypothetical protein
MSNGSNKRNVHGIRTTSVSKSKGRLPLVAARESVMKQHSMALDEIDHQGQKTHMWYSPAGRKGGS